MTRQADLKRRVRDRMARTGEPYTTARRHIVAAASPPSATGAAGLLDHALHVTNGDATDLPGALAGVEAAEVLFWRDVLHEGPVPDVDEEELRRIRADFLAGAGCDDRGEGAAMFAERDRVLAAHREGRYVLWFEADLYDQLQVAQILSRLGAWGVPAERVTMVSIGEHPGIARFGGLGQLTAAQLRALAETDAAVPMTPSGLLLAGQAWAAFRAPTPRGLAAITASTSPELRFLAEAFDRICREYPSTRDGLSLTERRILAAVADGAADAGSAFQQSSARETRPFLGDTWCFARIQQLTLCEVPLLAVPGRDVVWTTPVRLTEAGGDVLAGLADHIELNGVDRWIGGVHLHGSHAAWRWDEGREAVVARDS